MKEIANETIEKNVEIKHKKEFTIFDFPLIRILAWFIVYSIVGYIIETLFGLLTKGVIESRQSFLYGPFCSIYGVGAVVMVLGLQKFSKNNYTLFAGGFVIGSVVEYVISVIGEWFFHINMLYCIFMPVFLTIYYAYTTDYQNQGRYLLPALLPLMYYMIKGIQKLSELKIKGRTFPRWLVNTGVAICFLILVGGTIDMVYVRALPVYLETGLVLE